MRTNLRIVGTLAMLAVFATTAGCPEAAAPDDEQPPPGDDGGPVESEGGTSGDGPSSCDSNLTRCGERCVDTKTDTNHCGRCSHSCLGGSCTAGVCQVVDLASGFQAIGIAVSKTDVYATIPYEDRIVRIPKMGGAIVDVVKGIDADGAEAISLDFDANGDATRLLWGSGNTSPEFHLCDLPACDTVTTITSTYQVQDITSSGDRYFWTESSLSSGKVRRCIKDTCAASVSDVLPNEPGASGLVVSGNFLLWTRHVSAGTVRRSTISGSGVIDLIPSLGNPDGLAFDGANVYAAVNGDSVVAKCPVTGCTGGSTTFSLATYPHDVATDGKNVYWSNGLANGGSVQWCPVDGCGTEGVRMLADKQANPFGIKVDADAVYWVNYSSGGGIKKITKP